MRRARDRRRSGSADQAAHASNDEYEMPPTEPGLHGATSDALSNRHGGTVGNLVQARDIGSVTYSGTSALPEVPRQLRAKPFGFVGRSNLLGALDSKLGARLDGDELPAVIIHGLPGVGKTALVLEWAHRQRERFVDGDLFADLHDFDVVRPSKCEEVLDGFLRGLGVPALEIPAKLDAQSALFRSMVANRRILIVLDNVGSADRVRPFVAGTNSFLLVTSRSQLRGLSAREGAQQMSVETLSPDEAIRLLAEIAGTARMSAEMTAAESLAQRCGYLPLALRIAADQINARSYLTIAEHLQDLEATGVGALSVDDDEHTQVRTVFSWSYRTLQSDSALVFRLLGLNPGRDISLQAIVAMTELSARAARRAVQELLSVSLLTESDPNRYVMHSLLREYAEDMVEGGDDLSTPSTATRRLINWYAASVDNANTIMTPGSQRRDDFVRDTVKGLEFASMEEALAWLEAERSNLIDITRRAGEIGEHHTAAIMPNLLWTYYNLTKHWSDWITCNEIGLASAREIGDRKSEAYLLTSQGVAFRNLRQSDEAIASHERAIRLFEEIDEDLGLGYAQQNLGNVYGDVRRYDEALDNFALALQTFSRLPEHKRGRGVALNSLAVCLNDMGRAQDALSAAQEARTIMQDIGDDNGLSFSLNSAGRALARLGQVDEAVLLLRDAIALRERIGDRYGQGRSLLYLGDIFLDFDRTDEAQQAWAQALEIFIALGAPERTDASSRIFGDSTH